MPRLTNKQYLERHRALRKIWLETDKFFGVVPYTQQMDVHIFYAPARDWSDEKMLEHRQKVQEFDDSLLQRASRGYLKIEAAYLAPVNESATMKVPVGEGTLRVTAIARPEVNSKQLASALLELERRQTRVERKMAA
jgi:hypothetical protein